MEAYESKDLILLVLKTSYKDLTNGLVSIKICDDIKLTDQQTADIDKLVIQASKIIIQGIRTTIKEANKELKN